MALRGFLNIDKPAGITSFDVVRRVRRAAGIRKVGHAGTLDPAATGVLPVAIGDATKLIEELVDAPKAYRGVIRFGVATDTYDADGQAVAECDASAVTRDAIEAQLDQFRGDILQAPPAFSAVKRDGEPAYRAARRGEPMELEPRPVTVYALEVGDLDASDPGPPRHHRRHQVQPRLLRPLPRARPRRRRSASAPTSMASAAPPSAPSPSSRPPHSTAPANCSRPVTPTISPTPSTPSSPSGPRSSSADATPPTSARAATSSPCPAPATSPRHSPTTNPAAPAATARTAT